MTKFEIEEKIVSMLKTVFDPEIPVNVYDLGLIYKIDVSDQGEASIDMTLTAPNCPAADFIMEDVRQKVESIDGVTSATINLVFEPEWDKDMMSEEAKLELGRPESGQLLGQHQAQGIGRIPAGRHVRLLVRIPYRSAQRIHPLSGQAVRTDRPGSRSPLFHGKP